MTKYSIIVPIYNTEKYLAKCFDSILAQDTNNYEIVAVIDGSPDNSKSICEEYAKIHSQIHVIEKPNGGISSARNAGMDAAQGEYIYFLDSDDEMIPNMLRTIDTLGEADCYYSNYVYTKDLSNNVENNSRYLNFDDSLDWHEIAVKFCIHHASTSFALYRKAIIEKIQFDTSVKIGEDDLWVNKVMFCMRSFVAVDIPLFMYNINRPGSATTNPDLDSLYSGLVAYKSLTDKYMNDESEGGKLLLARYTQSFWNIARRIFKNPEYRRHEAYQLVLSQRFTLKFTNYKVDKAQKLLMKFLGLNMGVKLLNFLISIR